MEVKMEEINLEALTVDDCIRVNELMGIKTVIENGRVIGLVEEV